MLYVFQILELSGSFVDELGSWRLISASLLHSNEQNQQQRVQSLREVRDAGKQVEGSGSGEGSGYTGVEPEKGWRGQRDTRCNENVM